MTTNAPGGGLRAYLGSNPVIRRCKFIDNTAFQGGGIYVAVDSSATVDDCEFTGNSVIDALL